MPRSWLLSLALLTACSKGADVVQDPFPDFFDDGQEQSNDSVEQAAGLPTSEDDAAFDATITDDDLDVFRVDIAPGQRVSVELDLGGDGTAGHDLDLWVVDNPADPLPSSLDLVDDEPAEGEPNVTSYSATEQPYERVAFMNLGEATITRYVAIDGYEGATGDYALRVRVDDWHDTQDCDEAYPDGGVEGGPCNRILQFPAANDESDGYLVSHESHYSNQRREVAYLVAWAAKETAIAFPDTLPLGLGDMSQRDGDVPGRMRGQLRHPEGTHVGGNDIDIAYYQNTGDNHLRTVCPDDDYFCTADPHLLDARRTAYFMTKLASSDHIRVIGVDTKIAPKVNEAAAALMSEGLITFAEKSRMSNHMAYGEGWPFHQHHMHFSWSWEDGHEGRSNLAHEGCAHKGARYADSVPRRATPWERE